MTTQISVNILFKIMILLKELKRSFDENGEKESQYTTKRNIEELLGVLTMRIHENKLVNNSSQNLQLSGQEAGEILRACWETQNLYRRYGEENFNNLGVSAHHFRSTLNQIASVLSHIAEM